MNPTDMAATIARELGRDPSEAGTARLAKALAPHPYDELPANVREAAELCVPWNPSLQRLLVSIYRMGITMGKLEHAEAMVKRLDDAAKPAKWTPDMPCPHCKCAVINKTTEAEENPDGVTGRAVTMWSCDDCGTVLDQDRYFPGDDD